MVYCSSMDKKAIHQYANIKVVGVGGAGGNAINRMIAASLQGVEFWVIPIFRRLIFHWLNIVYNWRKVNQGFGWRRTASGWWPSRKRKQR